MPPLWHYPSNRGKTCTLFVDMRQLSVDRGYCTTMYCLLFHPVNSRVSFLSSTIARMFQTGCNPQRVSVVS